MDTERIADIFKTKASELREALNPHFTPEIKLVAAFMEAMKPEMLCSAFNTHVRQPYAEKIKAKDADFFLNSDSLVEGSKNDPTIVALKATWGQLDEDDRDDVWALLDQMCSLSATYLRASIGDAN